jgi:surface antigen
MSATSVATYIYGQCTYFVARSLDWVPGGLGNAGDWFQNARARGMRTSGTPHAGDVVVYRAGWIPMSPLGHVAVVDAVQPGGKFTVTEMTNGAVSTRQSNMMGVLGFIEPPPKPQTASSSPGQNPFAAWLGQLAGYYAAQQGQPQTAASSSSNSAFPAATISFPGGSVNIPNPLQGVWDSITGHIWQAALVMMGGALILVGLFILFRPTVEPVIQQATDTAKTAGEAAAVAG